MDARVLLAGLRAVRAQIQSLASRFLPRVGLSLVLVMVLFTGTFAQIGQAGIGTIPALHSAAAHASKNTLHPSTDNRKTARVLPSQQNKVNKLPPAVSTS